MSGKHVENEVAAVLKEFDEWVRQTGAVGVASSWRYEIESMLSDAVVRGDQAAFRALNIYQMEQERKARYGGGTPYWQITWSYDVEDLRVIAVPDRKLHLADPTDPATEYMGWAACGMLIQAHFLTNEEIPTRWSNPTCGKCWEWLRRRNEQQQQEREDRFVVGNGDLPDDERAEFPDDDEYAEDRAVIEGEGFGFIHM